MTPPETWVCDGCMMRVIRSQIAVWADGEHVLCWWCDRDQANDPRDAVKREAAADALDQAAREFAVGCPLSRVPEWLRERATKLRAGEPS